MEKNIYKIGKELFITSEEEIKEGDWCIMTNDYGDNYLVRVISLKCIGGKEIRVLLSLNNQENTTLKKNCKKIILTTDQDLDGVQAIDDEFLEWFVKNSSCERVEIRYTVDFNSKAVIIIPKEEPKQVTLEEVAEEYAISKSSSSVFQKAHIRDFIAGAKWQQERMYSDMQEYAEFCVKCDRNKMPLLTVEDWYKQYKK